MPKALKVHPGERVDLVDYVQGANDYTKNNQKFLVERELADRRSRIFDGFKVKIEDQTLNPGLITVFNGNAADRSGQLVNNEDTANDSRSITLLGTNTNFYIEIEYTEANSDTDARYFWDPTYANTAPAPDGSEFLINVATRISPDWRVVTPVSTTGFQQDASPNSVRIPLCVLRTNGSNQITPGVDNPGLALVTPSSVLETDLSTPGFTSFRVADARVMPVPPFNITLDFGGALPESLTVTAIDRVNGVLTVGTATAVSHQAGAIVRVVGTPLFVEDKTDPNFPVTNLAIPGHPDLAQRMWQADEIRGSGLLQSKETFGARDDLNLRCLKDELDFLSAQIREMKFGHPRTDTTSAAPPAAFNTRPRYFDPAGSIQGAKSNTVSIGNGTTTFGDFNGTDEVPFIAAVNALPASGGTIFVKSGSYDFSNTVTIGKSVTIIGESFNSTTVVNLVAAGPAFSLTADALIENLTISQGTGGAYLAIDLAGSITLTLNYSRLLAAVRLNGAVSAAVHARRTMFSNNDPGVGLFTETGGGTLTLSHFDACSFTNLAGAVFTSAINSLTVTNSFVFAVSVLNAVSTTATTNNVTIQNCDITVTATVLFSYGTQTCSSVRLLNNQITSLTLPAGFAVCWFTSTTALTNFSFNDNTVTVLSLTGTYVSPAAVVSTTANTNLSDVRLQNNTVTFPSNPTAWGVFYVTDAASTLSKNVLVTGNSVLRGNSLVRLGSAAAQMSGGNYVIAENCHNNSSSTEAAIGVEFYNTISPPKPTYVNILNNTFSNYTYNAGAGGLRIGVECTFDSAVNAQVNVEGNLMYNFSSSVATTYAAGINFSPILTAANGSLRVVGNRILLIGSTNADNAGISIRPTTPANRIDVDVSNNVIFEVGSYVGTSPINSYGILLDTVVTGTVSNNYVYNVSATTGDGSCLSLNACGYNGIDTAGVVVNNNKLFNGYTALASANSGFNINVTGSSSNLNICNNVCSQFGSVVKANYCISLGVCENCSVTNNTLITATNSTAVILGAFGLRVQGGKLKNVRIASNTIDLYNTSWASGIHVKADAFSSGVTIECNSIQERSLTGGDFRLGIALIGDVSFGGTSLTTGASIRNNTIDCATAGAPVAFRIGIFMQDCRYSQVSNNLVNWLKPTIAEGVGISITAVSALYPWSGIACVGNVVTNDANALTADIMLDLNIQSAIVASNVVGDFLSNGVITPIVAPANWQYGVNLVN